MLSYPHGTSRNRRLFTIKILGRGARGITLGRVRCNVCFGWNEFVSFQKGYTLGVDGVITVGGVVTDLATFVYFRKGCTLGGDGGITVGGGVTDLAAFVSFQKSYTLGGDGGITVGVGGTGVAAEVGDVYGDGFLSGIGHTTVFWCTEFGWALFLSSNLATFWKVCFILYP